MGVEEYVSIILRMFGSKKPKQKVYSGWPGDCSEQQLQALNDFRGFVVELSGGKPDPRWDDHYLLRFLRARKFSKVETEKMWRKFIDWRIKNDIDNAFKFYLPEIIQLRKGYPHGYHKVDKTGRPIYIERVGFLNVEEIFKYTNEERLLKYNACSYETLLTTIFDACTEHKRKMTGEDVRVSQTITILDLKDVKLGSASKAYNFVKPASEMAQDNYPEILGNMFIVNAPFLFTGIWAIVKAWIDEKTKEKIKILGGSYKKQLLQYIDPQNLPSFLEGGTCKCEGNGGDCLGWNIGPWNPEGKELFASNFVSEQEAEKKVEAEKKEQAEKKEESEKVEEKVEEKAEEKKEETKRVDRSNKEVAKKAPKTQE